MNSTADNQAQVIETRPRSLPKPLPSSWGSEQQGETHFKCLCGRCCDGGRDAGIYTALDRFGAWRINQMGFRGSAASVLVQEQEKGLPFEDLSLAALDRQRETGQGQVLILFEREVEGRINGSVRGLTQTVSRVSVAERSGARSSFVSLVRLCSLERLGHPDILHALVTGYDQVWIQRATDVQGFAEQRLELSFVEALGGRERCRLFSDLVEVKRGTQNLSRSKMQILPDISPESSRWEIAHACAKALLPIGTAYVQLPEQAPYGQLALSSEGCDQCDACTWVCPTEAISLSPDGCTLTFTESNCVQCGLCVSVCHRRSLHMFPTMSLSTAAQKPRPFAALTWPKEFLPSQSAKLSSTILAGEQGPRLASTLSGLSLI